MACLVYTKVNGEIKCERVCATQVDSYLQSGYASSPEQLEVKVEDDEPVKLSYKEIKEACIDKGIKVGGKSKEKLLAELGL
jgi:hypothetical protein